MGRYVSTAEYEGDLQVARQHGLIEDNNTIWVDDD